MIEALKVAALVLVVLTVVTSLGHALELPGKMRLEREEYLAVQPIYYPGFTYAGAAEPLAIIVVAVLLAFTPSGTTAFWLTVGALVAVVVTHLIYWTITAPVNKFWLKDEKLSGGAKSFFGSSTSTQSSEWTELRDRWERSHLYRAASASTAFFLLTIAIVIE
jgi:hypothetical protein